MSLTEYEVWYRSRFNRTSSALISTTLIVSDLFGVMISFGTGFFLVNLYDLSIINFKSFVMYWPYLPVFIVFFVMFRLYPGIALAPADELRNFTLSSLLAHGGVIFSRYIEDAEFDIISAAFIVSFCFSPVILLTCRSLTHFILRKAKIKGIPAVIYGSGNTWKIVADQLLKTRRLGYVPVLILDNSPDNGDDYRGIPIIHDTGVGPEIVGRFNIKMAIIAMSGISQGELARLINDSVSAFRYNVLIPDFVNVANIWMSVRDFDGILGFATTHRLRMSWNLTIKRCLDMGLVIVGGIIIFPLLLAIALLIKLSSPGPVLYKHKRLGQNGRELYVYKFRSMVANADEKLKAMLETDPKLRAEWDINFKLKDDPRITGIGKFLRRTSFDEFPQLINIIKGEMSLVGPRPVTQGEVERYGEDFHRIFSVKPGLTGLWQVSGRSDTDYEERIAYDSYYLQSWSVWIDIWVLYKTIGVIFRGKGAY
jgi:Undecaprenyl-phosphate galactose phosphotransferase WbaP